ncbi:MAG TPA: methyltransferase domain-containing protein [Anaerolineae bacterium]
MTLRQRAKDLYYKAQFNASRAHLERFLREASRSIPDGSLVLDAGAGETRYRLLFDRHHYEAADSRQSEIMDYGNIDYVCNLESIPVQDNRYDLVICTQVLEHVPHPALVLRELLRVLTPGGQLWLTAPFVFDEHMQPYDYYRYTQYGLRFLLTSTGFAVDRLERLDGYYVALSYQLATAARALPFSPSRYGGGVIGVLMMLAAIILKPSFLLLSLLYSRLDERYKNTASGYSKNYAAVARKPTK